jgi:hypothetical protein
VNEIYMKIKNKISTLVWFMVFAVLLWPSISLGQGPPPPPSPPGGGGGPPCWPPPCVPINKGLVFLAIAALLLAVYQLRIFRTKTK